MNFANIEFPYIDLSSYFELLFIKNEHINLSYSPEDKTSQKELIEEYSSIYDINSLIQKYGPVLFVTKDKDNNFAVLVQKSNEHIWDRHGEKLLQELKKSDIPEYQYVEEEDIPNIIKDIITLGEPYCLTTEFVKKSMEEHDGEVPNAYLYKGIFYLIPIEVINCRIASTYIPSETKRKRISDSKAQVKKHKENKK